MIQVKGNREYFIIGYMKDGNLTSYSAVDIDCDQERIFDAIGSFLHGEFGRDFEITEKGGDSNV